MALIDEVKNKIGIFYSDPKKDAEIAQSISAAQLYFKGAGWDVTTPDALGIEGIALFCKMAQNTDPMLLQNHPILISFITQGRAKPNEV